MAKPRFLSKIIFLAQKTCHFDLYDKKFEMPPKKKSKIDKVGSDDKKICIETDEQSSKVKDEKPCFWLMKAEPECRIQNGVDVKFGINDLMNEPNQTACWDGVRNYQARNFMRDQMKVGEMAFFYHSNCKPPGIAGIMMIEKEGYVDHTQFDKKAPYFDPKSSKENPKWFMVDVKFIRKLKRYIPLNEIKMHFLDHKSTNGPLKNIALFTKSRLSVQPVTKEEFDFILTLENEST